MAGQPPSASAERPRGEESPGSTETRCRITSGGGDPRESATESRPPSHARVRVKGWGKSPPRTWRHGRHGKPHREQDRIGMTRAAQAAQPVSGPVIRVGCTRPGASPVPDEWLPRSGFGRSHTEPGLQANWRFPSSLFRRAIRRARRASAVLGRSMRRCAVLTVTSPFSSHRLCCRRPLQAPEIRQNLQLNPVAWGRASNLSLNLTAYKQLMVSLRESGQFPLTPIWSHGIP
ncbi:hypothetical protein SAMN05892877_107122 [Rhizobium subbaraonis]|uniref:Uncharacterized protein n=1 Tax=Rhizobium subbaraonis TaxID=908946 RepID=A0A285UEG4_9HYPH|nr:hypothetical protein SAMN05892877_107122 [Rhizobium subbaraonis]